MQTTEELIEEREGLRTSLEILRHKDRWDFNDTIYANTVLQRIRTINGILNPVPPETKEREKIPENETLSYTLNLIKETFGVKNHESR